MFVRMYVCVLCLCGYLCECACTCMYVKYVRVYMQVCMCLCLDVRVFVCVCVKSTRVRRRRSTRPNNSEKIKHDAPTTNMDKAKEGYMTVMFDTPHTSLRASTRSASHSSRSRSDSRNSALRFASVASRHLISSPTRSR